MAEREPLFPFLRIWLVKRLMPRGYLISQHAGGDYYTDVFEK